MPGRDTRLAIGNRVNHQGLCGRFVKREGSPLVPAGGCSRLIWIILGAGKDPKLLLGDKQELHLVCLTRWVVRLGSLICGDSVGTLGLGQLRPS